MAGRDRGNRTGKVTGTRNAAGEVTIKAPRERVWRALTEARELERWFPLEASVEPGEGGVMRLSWKNEFVGELGILAWDPPVHLRTGWAFHAHDHDVLQVTDYHLTGQGGTTRLRVVTSGFPDDPSWDAWVEGTVRGWSFELRSLKHYLERFPGMDRDVVYLRCRSNLRSEEVWARLFPAGAAGLSGLDGEVFDRVPGVQHAVVTNEPEGGLLRVSLEPAAMGSPQRDLTVWLSVWDADASAISRLTDRWRQEIHRLLPEGEDL